MKLMIATACAFLSLAGASYADTTLTATLDTPQAAHAKFIAAHAVWNCDGATCTASVAPDDSASVDGCQDLTKKIGRVSAYSGEGKTLDAKSLDKCNKTAAVPA